MKNNNSLSLIKEMICYNQSHLTQYILESGEKHKKIKNLIPNSQESSIDDYTLKELNELCNELENYINNQLDYIFKENFKYLLKYFRDRSETPPRVCVKVLVENQIYTLFRDRYLMLDNAYKADENTAFIEIIKEREKYYFCNNIPQEIKNKKYVNSRIIEEHVNNYVEPNLYKKVTSFLKNDFTDYEWIKCWTNVQLKNNVQSNSVPCIADLCYKSTLVVPMSLLVKDLKKTFIDYFKIDDKKERAIFGFLCLDHQKKNYFNEDDDVDILYIFADILSVYLIENIKYTASSSTFDQAKKLLK